jgi:hypothetical protein
MSTTQKLFEFEKMSVYKEASYSSKKEIYTSKYSINFSISIFLHLHATFFTFFPKDKEVVAHWARLRFSRKKNVVFVDFLFE